ncbi:MAG: hypothetical protein JNG85_13825 [Spirochaetaceae bacterium]|nr:hypothetical protein [Spirochaetaceae bacterium]
MEEIGKRRLAAAAIALAGIAYFFACARPLPKTLVLAPGWARALPAAALSAAPAAAPSGAAAPMVIDDRSVATLETKAGPGSTGFDKGASGFPYALAGRYGYFDAQGLIASADAAPFGLAQSKGAYIAYDRLPESLSLRSAGGAELARITEPGYPFFAAGRLFLLRPGQASVAEIGPDGAALWSRDFPSIVTAFDASEELALFGLMDGSLVGVGPKGAELLSFSPGGSRIAGIYGCAVSPDGEMVAAVSGLDRQRLVVLERRSAAYRVTYHRWLESDYRRPVAMAFTGDGSYLAYESPTGLGLYDRAARREASLSAARLASVGEYLADRGLLLLLEGGGAEKGVLIASPAGRRLFTAPFTASEAFVSRSGDAVFLGIAEGGGAASILRMDLKEE